MIRSILATTLFTALISSAYSINVVHHFEALNNKQFMKESSAAVHKPKVATNHTDFSGTWEGVCNYNGESERDTMRIETLKDYISLDDEFYFYDTLSTESVGAMVGFSVYHKIVNWSDDGSTLNFYFIDVEKHFSSAEQTPLTLGRWAMTFSLDDGALVIKSQADYLDKNNKFDCRMNKIAE